MKTINDYTDEEVAALSYEDIEKLKKLALATEGIKIPVAPEQPSLNALPEPDASVWQVEGTNLEFSSKESADAVATALSSEQKNLCDTNTKYGRNYSVKLTHISDLADYKLDAIGSIKEKKVYSKALYSQIKELVKANTTLQDAYEDELKEYKQNSEDASAVTDAIDTRVNEVEERFTKLARLLDQFGTYVSLADGDLKQAEKFFVAAYTPNADDLAWVLKRHMENSVEASAS